MRVADDIAIRRDLDPAWVRQAIGQSYYLPQVARFIQPPPVGTPKNWRVYRSRFIDPVRINAGVKFWRENAGTLERAEQEYGVPAEIIVGIVGEVVLVPKLVEQEQYSRAGDFLEEALGYERGRDLLEFAYDWRQDVRQSAQRLAETIDAWPVEPPITIIAHSLGTLVSRYYIERLGGKHKVGRVLLIGGPHQGTPRIATDLIQGVGLLPFGLFGDRLLDVIKTFPSVYQILPTYPCTIDQHGQPIDLLADEGVTRYLAADMSARMALEAMARRELEMIRNADGSNTCSGDHHSGPEDRH